VGRNAAVHPRGLSIHLEHRLDRAGEIRRPASPTISTIRSEAAFATGSWPRTSGAGSTKTSSCAQRATRSRSAQRGAQLRQDVQQRQPRRRLPLLGAEGAPAPRSGGWPAMKARPRETATGMSP
jgi:hypothetical protein